MPHDADDIPDDEALACESCEARYHCDDPDAGSSLDGCTFCPKCWSDIVAAVASCDHAWEPYGGGEIDGPARICRQCSYVEAAADDADSERPSEAAWDGRPENPERDAAHVLRHKDTGQEHQYWWDTMADLGPCWDSMTAARAVQGWEYVGPCLTPSALAAERASRADEVAAAAEAMREACARWHDEQAVILHGDARNASELGCDISDAGGTLDHYARLHDGHAANLRALPTPTTPALAERDARVRREALEEAAKVAEAKVARIDTLAREAAARGQTESADTYRHNRSGAQQVLNDIRALAAGKGEAGDG